MTAAFGSLTAALDAAVMSSLNDGTGDHLSAAGAVLASGLELILDRDVERLDLASGALDRSVTITVQKHLLQPLDRKGAFLLDGKTWHIDGIASDDGHLITFYVVP
ncbi:hypothetical protein E0E50_03150 [Azotobacter chroococcum subsp. isscasi]|uniref:hypothetical protein n=1 Tax=Azotobacter chroococcum TaxID=353 RepID=UPI00103F3AC4|nr:hypothetical protein [Azotobacter chroococcum]TBW12656.1 hypothetical protein E0E50_03150 [Azotobacter chroococcum subsp. isscasi]